MTELHYGARQKLIKPLFFYFHRPVSNESYRYILTKTFVDVMQKHTYPKALSIPIKIWGYIFAVHVLIALLLNMHKFLEEKVFWVCFHH